MYEVPCMRAGDLFFPTSKPVEIPILSNELYKFILEKLIAPPMARNRKKEEIILQLFQTSLVCKKWYVLSNQILCKICPLSIKNFSESIFQVFSTVSAARVCTLKYNWQKQIYFTNKTKVKKKFEFRICFTSLHCGYIGYFRSCGCTKQTNFVST